MPYGQRPDPNHYARLLAGLFPEGVRKGASAAELNGRLAEARRLAAQANDVTLDPLLRSQARAMAQQVLAAPVQKAPVRDWTGRLADEAYARVVAKAGRGGGDGKPQMQAVFDQDGNLVGVVDPAKIQPVAGHGAARPAPAPADTATQAPPAQPAAAGQVAKSRAASDAQLVQQVIKALGPKKYLPVHDWLGAPVGIVKRKHVTALPAGQVTKGAAAADRANVYDASRRRIGEARLSDIVPLAELRAARKPGRPGGRAGR